MIFSKKIVLLLVLLLLTGCSQLADDKGKLNMDKIQTLANIAKESGARVSASFRLRPAKVGFLEAFYIDTGIEADFYFDWEGDEN